MPETTDVIIVGGGSTGTSTALNLARRGIKVILLEKKLVGSGQSGHAAGIARTHTPVIVAAEAAKESLEFYGNMKDTTGTDVPFHHVGFLIIFPPGIDDLVRKHAEFLKSIDCHSDVITVDDARELFPPIQCDESATLLFEPGAGYIDPMAATRAIADAAIDAGVDLREGVQVTRVTKTGDRVSGVETTDGPIAASNVFLATAMWTNHLLQEFDIQIPVRPHRTEAIFIRRPPDLHGDHPVIDDKHHGVYYRPEGPEQSYVGYLEAMRNPDFDKLAGGDPDNLRSGNTYETVQDLREKMARRAPAYAKSYWKGGFPCVYDVTEDWLPILDEVEGIPGLFVASGFSGGGFHLGPWVGRTMSEYIANASRPEELKPFAERRFREGRLTRGVYPFAR